MLFNLPTLPTCSVITKIRSYNFKYSKIMIFTRCKVIEHTLAFQQRFQKLILFLSNKYWPIILYIIFNTHTNISYSSGEMLCYAECLGHSDLPETKRRVISPIIKLIGQTITRTFTLFPLKWGWNRLHHYKSGIDIFHHWVHYGSHYNMPKTEENEHYRFPHISSWRKRS